MLKAIMTFRRTLLISSLVTLLIMTGCGGSDTAVSDSDGGDTALAIPPESDDRETSAASTSYVDDPGSDDRESPVAIRHAVDRQDPIHRRTSASGEAPADATRPDSIQPDPIDGPIVAIPAKPKLLGKREQIERYDDGQIRRRFVARIYSNNEVVFHGPYVEYYPNGKRFKQGMYVDNKQDGMWGYWHDNGRIAKKGRFILGKHDGIWIYKTERGHMRRQESYKDGLKDGLWIVYGREPGTKIREERWKDDKRHGQCTEFFPKTGGTQQITEWVNGKRHGKESIWFKDGKKAVEREYKDGQLHGRAVAYAPSGAIRTEMHYVDGERQTD